tara:strand:+ start:218 stop:460 length:243 start_codon:yes stop_codon:yes gene_type:complete
MALTQIKEQQMKELKLWNVILVEFTGSGFYTELIDTTDNIDNWLKENPQFNVFSDGEDIYDEMVEFRKITLNNLTERSNK